MNEGPLFRFTFGVSKHVGKKGVEVLNFLVMFTCGKLGSSVLGSVID